MLSGFTHRPLVTSVFGFSGLMSQRKCLLFAPACQSSLWVWIPYLQICLLYEISGTQIILGALWWLSWALHRHGVVKWVSRPKCSFPAEVRQGDSLLSCFSCHSVNKCPSHGLFGAMFSVFFYFFWWFHCFQWPPSTISSAACVSKCKKFLMKKPYVLGKLCPGMSYSAVGCWRSRSSSVS